MSFLQKGAGSINKGLTWCLMLLQFNNQTASQTQRRCSQQLRSSTVCPQSQAAATRVGDPSGCRLGTPCGLLHLCRATSLLTKDTGPAPRALQAPPRGWDH